MERPLPPATRLIDESEVVGVGGWLRGWEEGGGRVSEKIAGFCKCATSDERGDPYLLYTAGLDGVARTCQSNQPTQTEQRTANPSNTAGEGRGG